MARHGCHPRLSRDGSGKKDCPTANEAILLVVTDDLDGENRTAKQGSHHTQYGA